MKAKILVKCPYCGFINQFTRDVKYATEAAIERCDVEDGGCDKKFVFEYEFEIVIHAKACKIDL